MTRFVIGLFIISFGPPIILIAAWYFGYWLESGNRVRFSLRTLLIAMTLVAVVLGLIVWLR
jgi:hypothetical protein